MVIAFYLVCTKCNHFYFIISSAFIRFDIFEIP